MITVFTPTYNRAYIIRKLYKALCGQINKNFEWLVVDDGFCVVMFGLINVNILYYSFSTLYQMCNLRQSL